MIERVPREAIARILEDAGEPLTAKEIARAVGRERGNSVQHQLTSLEREGRAARLNSSGSYRWIGKTVLDGRTTDAYRVLIAHYRQRCPKTAEFLEGDRELWIRSTQLGLTNGDL